MVRLSVCQAIIVLPSKFSLWKMLISMILILALFLINLSIKSFPSSKSHLLVSSYGQHFNVSRFWHHSVKQSINLSFSILSETLFTAFCFLKYLHKFCVCNIISIFTILPSIFHFLLKYNLTEKNKDLMKIAK